MPTQDVQDIINLGSKENDFRRQIQTARGQMIELAYLMLAIMMIALKADRPSSHFLTETITAAYHLNKFF